MGISGVPAISPLMVASKTAASGPTALPTSLAPWAKATVSAERISRGTNGFSAPSARAASLMALATGEPVTGSPGIGALGSPELVVIVVVESSFPTTDVTRLKGPSICFPRALPRSTRRTRVIKPTPAPMAIDATTPMPTGWIRSAFGPLMMMKPLATVTVMAMKKGWSMTARLAGLCERCTTYRIIQ